MVVVQRLRPLLSKRLLGDLEIDLALEVVHFGDLHLDVVAELENAAGAASDQLRTGGVELIKIVTQTGERHQAAHAEARDIDKKAEVAHVGDERRVARWIGGFELGIEEGEHFHVPAVALGIIGIAFGLGNVVGSFLERMREAVVAVK